MRIRMTEQRERRLKRAMEAMGENTKAGAIDRALKHYLADKRNKEQVADELPGEIVQELSTPQLPIERETTVGE
jgi:hypothetical protein